MSFSSLSPELWQRIMENADQGARARASSVSKAMQAAAVAAMGAVYLECGMHDLDSLQLWPPKYGQHVTRFETEGYDDDDAVLAELPCPRLQELRLAFSVPVLLGPSTLGPGVLQGCPGLTRLQLWCPVLDDDGLEGIFVLTDLRWLNPMYGNSEEEEEEEQNTDLWLPGSVLQHCSRLTHLYLSAMMAADDWQYLSCLVDLQELHLSTLSHITCSTLPGGLPSSLRVLNCSKMDVLDPALLSTLTNLQRLAIGDYYGRFWLEDGAAGDALLRAIAQLQQLEELRLSQLNCDWPPMSNDHPTLTASSSLTKLHLRSCSLKHSPPAWQHVFSPGWMLQSITIAYPDAYHVSKVQGAVKQLVACCPKLQDLHLYCRMGPTVDVALLGQLSALTALDASYSSITDVGEVCQVLQQLACLTRLEDLDLSLSNLVSESLGVSALLPLTALRQLTHLKCTRHLCRWGDHDALISSTSPPDVWQQLLKLCSEKSS